MVAGQVNSVDRWRYNSMTWRVCSASCSKKPCESYHPHRPSPRLGDEVVNHSCAACFNNRAARSLANCALSAARYSLTALHVQPLVATFSGQATLSFGTAPQKAPSTVNVSSPPPLHAPSLPELPVTSSSTYSFGPTVRPFTLLVPPRWLGNVGPNRVNARFPVLYTR